MCVQKFMTNRRLPDAYVLEKNDQLMLACNSGFQMLCVWLEVDADA